MRLTNKLIMFFDSTKIQFLMLGLFAAVIPILFISIGIRLYAPGFPLDDSWIHQTYARNIILTGQWQFIPGQLSAGSTSPLWTLLLSIRTLLGFDTPYFWTFFLSVLCFIGLVLTVFKITKTLQAGNHRIAIFAGLAMIFEWHFLWSAASGMESLLYCFVILLVFLLLLSPKPNTVLLGLLSGLVIWVRPDGITLLGPILLVFLFKVYKKEMYWSKLFVFFILFGLLFCLYGWFNFEISGKFFPNTFYAKQLEYASLLERPLLNRLTSVFSVVISGASVILLPGFIWNLFSSFRKREIWKIGAILWMLGYGILYAVRLPVVYQHGRYLFPIIPLFMIIGIDGSNNLFNFLESKRKISAKLSSFMAVVYLAVSILFVISGEAAYVEDLKAIDQLMVKPALWIEENTPQDSIIAAHDVGALGYFSDREIIDLAGLIQEDVIPILRDEPKLMQYIQEKDANYLVVFSDWYPEMEQFGEIINRFNYSSEAGQEEVLIKTLNEE